MDIALLAPADVDRAVEGLAALLIDCVEGGASVGFLSPLAATEAEGFWRAALLAPGTLTWLARQGGRIVGSVQLKLPAFPNAVHRAEVAKLLVAQDARGRGIGSALLVALEAEAMRRRRTLLLLDTETGSAAEYLYRRLGWQAFGVVPGHAVTPAGHLGPTTFMFKRLPASQAS